MPCTISLTFVLFFGTAKRPWVRPIYDSMTELINVCIENPHVRSLELQVSEVQDPLGRCMPKLKPIFFVATGRELR